MGEHSMDKRSKIAGALTMVLLLVPMIGVWPALNIWFIPNADFKLPAAIVGVSYILLVFLLAWMVGRVNYLELWRNESEGARQTFFALSGVVMLGFCAFMTTFRAIPAEWTQLNGRSVDRDFTVRKVSRNQLRTNSTCTYTVTIESLRDSSDSDFCAGKELAQRLHMGEHLQLHGKETYFGFKFNSYSDGIELQ
jgi:hypothetical protein